MERIVNTGALQDLITLLGPQYDGSSLQKDAVELVWALTFQSSTDKDSMKPVIEGS